MLFLLPAGCGSDGSDGQVESPWGGAGREAGRFVKPRGLAVDCRNGRLYVCDMSGRVQQFNLERDFLSSVRVPDSRLGTGEGLAVTSGGDLLLADTHYHRIFRYRTEKGLEPIGSFGGMGDGPGQFRFPVAVAVDARDNIYVSEYGGNDRVQKFDPEGNFLLEWGSPGSGPGQFLRPSGLAVEADGSVLVADAANHRVQRFSPEGKLLAHWGRQGTGPGELHYPYDVAALPDGSVAVLEHYNNRIQRFSADGRYLGLFGGAGRDSGQFFQPWCLAIGPEAEVYVTDTMNHRLQVVRLDGVKAPEPSLAATGARN